MADVSQPSTTVSPSTGDTFSQAQQNINDQKAALVAAIAQGGTAGKSAYQQALGQIAQQKTDAVQMALKAATQGESAGTLAQIQGQVGAPYDRSTTDLTSAMASRQASLDQRGAQGSAYMDQAAAAIPAMRNMAEMKLADIRAKAAQQAASLASSEQLKQMSLAEAGMRLQAAMRGPQLTPYEQWQISQAQAKQADPASIIAQLGGAKQAGDLLYSKGSGLAAATQAQGNAGDPGFLASHGYTTDNSQGYYSDYAGQQAGLPSGMGEQLALGSSGYAQAAFNDALGYYQLAIAGKGPDGVKYNPSDALARIGQRWGAGVAGQVGSLYGKAKGL